MSISGYRDLDVWNKAIDLADMVYNAVATFPGDERFALTAQIKRSAVSVFSNIAEGVARNGTKEFIYHLGIAKGSLCELEAQLLFANKRTFLNEEECDKILIVSADVGKMLTKLIQALRKKL